MNLTSYILPYPYEAYTKFNRSREGFDHYKNKIYNWVEENTSKSNVSSHIDYGFSYVEDTECNRNIKEWLLTHIDKVRYIGDFSGLDFGVQIIENTESVGLRFPTLISEEDSQLYPLYDENVFKDLDIMNKLEWMYNHCEFIPFRIIYESIEVGCDTSYKFSHIKRDSIVMDYLSDYLEKLDFAPKDDVYYFILFTMYHGYHLKRDIIRSPKKK